MVVQFRKCVLGLGAAAWLIGAVPISMAANAQDGGYHAPPRPMGPSSENACRGRDRARCDRDRREWQRREERRRQEARRDERKRKEAKKDGVVAGIVGTAIVGGLIAAIASSGSKKSKEAKERERYCLSRYGNYDAATDSYRASDGNSYPCE